MLFYIVVFKLHWVYLNQNSSGRSSSHSLLLPKIKSSERQRRCYLQSETDIVFFVSRGCSIIEYTKRLFAGRCSYNQLWLMASKFKESSQDREIWALSMVPFVRNQTNNLFNTFLMQLERLNNGPIHLVRYFIFT